MTNGRILLSRAFVTLQYLLPHHLLCRLMFWLTRARTAWLKNALIRAFVRHYHPRLDEAAQTDPLRYPSFNAFFTRALKPGARSIDADPRHICSPCDGLLSMSGTVQAGQMLQAKGHRYTLEALLAGDAHAARALAEGSYATLYLAPYDYHRVHMPLEGRLRAAWHVPGRLFSVNAVTAAHVPRLFARNERVVCLFDGPCGVFAVVLVGALFVGSLSTVWHGDITPGKQARGGIHWLEMSQGVDAWQPRGAELGRFNMGSTVVLLLPCGAARWDSACTTGATVKLGQGLGILTREGAG